MKRKNIFVEHPKHHVYPHEAKKDPITGKYLRNFAGATVVDEQLSAIMRARRMAKLCRSKY